MNFRSTSGAPWKTTARIRWDRWNGQFQTTVPLGASVMPEQPRRGVPR
jgi:hypothetical protein